MPRTALFFIYSVAFAFLFLAMPLLVASTSEATTTTQGYVSYQVTVNWNGSVQQSFIVNESSVAASQNGFVDLTLGLTSSLQNFSYSKVVNASALPQIFPYVPGVSNQSFSYDAHGMSVSANILNSGTSSVTFKGATYTAQEYIVSATLVNSSLGYSVTGSILALPSGLLYSAQIRGDNSTASVQLLSTDLPLANSSSSVSTTEGAAMVGAGVLGAAAIAIPWKFKRKNNTKGGQGEKPPYWVD
jgi:hypothetical protein